MKIIKTPIGDYKFQPIELFHGRKKLDRAISRQNLLDFYGLIKKTQIRWGLVYGTLLGAVREKDFIQHDEDTDIFIYYEDRKDLFSLLFDLDDLGFNVVRYEGFLLSLMRDDNYIDLYFFRKTYKGRRAGELFIPSTFFESHESLDLFGVVFPTLSHHVDFLRYTYGSNWMVPIDGLHAQGRPVYWKTLILKVLSFFQLRAFALRLHRKYFRR